MFRINDIFYSLQGEGHNTGRAAVFVRFAGCNLRCPFCDTEFDTYREMTVDDIVTAIKAQLHIGHQTSDFRHLVVLTGGEPTLQVDEAFVDLLHQHGFEVAMESNGTRPAPRNLDWLTVSPKEVGGAVVRGSEGARFPDELKIIFDENTNPETFLVPPYLRTSVPPNKLQPLVVVIVAVNPTDAQRLCVPLALLLADLVLLTWPDVRVVVEDGGSHAVCHQPLHDGRRAGGAACVQQYFRTPFRNFNGSILHHTTLNS